MKGLRDREMKELGVKNMKSLRIIKDERHIYFFSMELSMPIKNEGSLQ